MLIKTKGWMRISNPSFFQAICQESKDPVLLVFDSESTSQIKCRKAFQPSVFQPSFSAFRVSLPQIISNLAYQT